MSVPFWVRPTGRYEEIAGAALEAGATGAIVPPEHVDDVETVGRLPVARLDGDKLELGDGTAAIVTVEDPDDQDDAKTLLGTVDTIIVQGRDWSIIPLENLIAWAHDSPTRLIAEVHDEDEAATALDTLETGAQGIVLATDDPATVHATARTLDDREGLTVPLEEATVERIEEAGMGDRVCVDTTSLLDPDEGLLVGSQSRLLALVASEATEAGYVASRPFRVNAGAVHAYALAPDDETLYLSEVQAGVDLVAVDAAGNARRVTTGRAKIERRPMLLLTVRTQDEEEGSLVLQNAETIRLVTPDGAPTSINELAPGDAILVHRAHEGGRHFGQAIQETLHEV